MGTEVVIIGAGVVGVSVAAELGRRGATVTLVDRDLPGAGTSSTSYGWVNANAKEPRGYYDLNLAGMRAHRELAAHGGEWLRANGHVEFAVDDPHRRVLLASMERLARRGYAVEEITVRRARELLPGTNIPADCGPIAYFADEAHCFPLRYLAFMLHRAVGAGVRVITRTPVTGLRATGAGGEVMLADGSVLAADAVVSCAGRWTGELAAMAGVEVPMLRFTAPGDVTVGYLAETGPVPVELDRLVTSRRLSARPAGGGRLLLQAPELDASADPGNVPSPASPVAAEMLARARSLFRDAEAAVISKLVVGQRAIPADGHTIVGRHPHAPWLYVVATHSGVTLAPLLGARVATEVLGGEEDLFTEFRPDRFFDAVTPR